uniref:Uncharacterized protein n=1 Tax=Sinorhizobium sp. M14 TaxID=430451 RepID=R4IL54_9HYPH|nr:hypothetical protein [Sinorhizobium sp. M14]
MTDHLAKGRKLAACGGQELREALHGGFSLSIADIAGIGRRPGQGGLHRYGRSEAEDLSTPEFWRARRREAAGKILMAMSCCPTTGLQHP